MSLGLVVSTLGRIDELRRLLDSVVKQLAPGDQFVIVAQGREAEVRELVRGYRSAGKFIVTSSARGVSLGRNVGVAALEGDDLTLLFPNDSSSFPPGVLDVIRRARPLRAGAITVRDENGEKFTLPEPGSPIDRWNVWSVIEIGLVIHSELFERLGGFDESLGTGASTPWQAAEGTDLLLRALERGELSTFTWFPRQHWVGGVADPHGLSSRQRRAKLRAYGRGMGRVISRHKYPLWWRIAFVAAGLLFGIRNRPNFAVMDGCWALLGRLEGVLGRAWGPQLTRVARE